MRGLILALLALCAGDAVARHNAECHGGNNLDMDSFGHTRNCFDVEQMYNLTDYAMNVTLATGEQFVLVPHSHIQLEKSERPFDASVMGPQLFSFVIDETGTLFVMEMDRRRVRGKR